MKIFFGGSTQRFYEHKKDYLAIRKIILELGNSLTRDWVKLEMAGKTDVHTTYYDLVEKAIRGSNAVILDYTSMSSSAGEQLLMAVERGIPTLLLIDASEKIKVPPLHDFFISSNHLKYVKKEEFNQKNLQDKITQFLNWVKENKSIARFNLELEKELDDYLKKKAAKNVTSKADEIRKLILKDMKK